MEIDQIFKIENDAHYFLQCRLQQSVKASRAKDA